MQKTITTIQNTFLAEKDQWILWFPVFFIIGILIYFALPSEPKLIYSISALAALVITSYLIRKNSYLFWIIIVLLSIITGFFTANIRTISIDAPILKKETGVKKITGIINEIDNLPHAKRYILDNPTIENITQKETPKKIRITINTNDNDAKPGDTISTLAALSPPPQPTIPGGYDFARYAYFAQVGAVGYSVADIEILSPSTLTITNAVAKIRRTIETRILAATDKSEGNIAAALLMGDQGGIEKQTINYWRISGIAHILSISGLHLSLAAAIFFFSARAILAAIPPIALQYNIKKLAAFIAILSSYAYLLLSGAPVPAQRSFIMTFLILIAIIIDRTGAPMRSIAFAATIILIFLPESALDPSFQMSFSSVIALISCHSLIVNYFKNYEHYGIIRRSLFYFFGIASSSLIAGIATAPFGIYHFNNFSSYGILSNLLAIPITSFIVMPAGVLVLLSMPFGLEKLALFPMSWGIKLTSQIAEYISKLPQPVGGIPQFSVASLCLLAFGILWFCIWKTKLRIYGAIPVIIGIILTFWGTTPDIIIDSSGKVFAVRTDDNQLVYSSDKTEKYARDTWRRKYAQEDTPLINQDDNENIKCDALGCIYHKNSLTTVFAKHPISLKDDCAIADIIINLTHFPTNCKTAKVAINLYDLKKNGTYVIAFDGGINITNVSEEKGERPWNFSAKVQ
jgi:competence protein ComEC